MSPLINEGTDLALRIGSASGQTIVNADSPLTRLNYFDGKFLRADDLRREQSYIRQLVQFSNQGLGAGVVYGMDTVLDSRGRLSIGAGLAMDSTGRTLLIGDTATLDIAQLIDASRKITLSKLKKAGSIKGADFGDCIDTTSTPGDGLTPAGSLYVICVGHAESLCGNEDVYGRLCEDACVTATDRPLVVEGVVVRALPLTLRTPLATSRVPLDRRHLRSLVASAYFEDERHVVGSLISRAGLSMDTWCVGAEMSAVGCVPLAVISRAGATTVFLDAWTVRRERMDAPAKRYWAWRMAMRPWDVFLAHVLQFQCHLHEVLGDDPSDPGNTDPCADKQSVLDETAKYLRDFDQSYTRHIATLSNANIAAAATQPQANAFQLQGGIADLARLRQRIDGALKVMIAGPRNRVLINGGIVELPSAGYLPVVPGTVTVNDQVRRLLGEGLDLRFCIVRPDYVPHALEEAQHMERISLLTGLDDPQAKPEVDILVPNGDLLNTISPSLAGFDTQLRLMPSLASSLADVDDNDTVSTNATTAAAPALLVHGAGRGEAIGSGGAFHFAGAQEAKTARQVIGLVNGLNDFVAAKPKARETMLRNAVNTATAASPFARASTSTDDVLSRFSARTAASAGAPVDIGASISTTVTTPLSTAAAAAAPAPLVGIWVTMRTERDPFSLGVAETTPMSVELTMTAERTVATGSTVHVLMRLRAFATFSTTQAAVDGATGRVMGGHLSGTFSTQALLETTTASDNTKPFDMDVKLLRTGNAAQGTVRMQLGDPKASFQFLGDVSWGGQPLEATLKLSLVAGQRLAASAAASNVVEVLSANAIAESDALAQGGPLRLLSTAALDLIGDELTRASQNGGAFVDVAQRLLFPPPPPPVDDLTVRATLDWVLFHRRRTKRCAPSTPQPTPTLPRRYQLYTLRAKSQQEVDLLRRALQVGKFTRTLQRVDIVEFASGAATLVTPIDALLSDWTAAQPGNTLAYGAVATSVAADVPLANARLSRVARGVSSISPFDPVQGVLEVLPSVPATMVVPGTDGIVLLITLDEVRTTCQDVYRVPLDPRTTQLLASGMLDQLLKLPQAINLGEADFDDGSTAVNAADAATLRDAWDKNGAGLPSQVVVFAKPNDSTGGDDATLLARGRSIADAVRGNPNTTVVTRGVEGPWPVGPGCPVITVIGVPAQRLMRVVVNETGGQVGMPVVQRFPIASDIVAFDGSVLQEDARFKAAMKELETFFSPGTIIRMLIGLEVATIGAPDAGAQDRLEMMFKALTSTTPPIADASRPRQRGVRAATTSEAAIFGEDGVDASDLLVMTIVQSINA